MTDTQKPQIIVLAKTLDLMAATPLHGALQAVRKQDVHLNADAVEHLGAQCLQVLLAAVHVWVNEKHEFKLIGAPSFFLKALQSFGCSEHIFSNPETV